MKGGDTMKKFLKLLTVLSFVVVLSCAMIPPPVSAGDKTLTFGWEQTLPIKGWYLYMSATSGVYSDPPILTVVYDGNPLNEYTADTVITSPDGQAHTYYFVLTSYDDATPPNESAHSNEVSQYIDFEPDATPFNLTVIIKATP